MKFYAKKENEIGRGEEEGKEGRKISVIVAGASIMSSCDWSELEVDYNSICKGGSNLSSFSESAKIVEMVDKKLEEGVEYVGIVLNGYSNGYLGERYDIRRKGYILGDTDRKKVEKNAERMEYALKALVKEMEHRVEDGVCKEVMMWVTCPLPRYLAGGGGTKSTL